MFGFGKKKEFSTEIIPCVRGAADGVYIEMRNYPVRVEVGSDKHIELYPDFNVHLMKAVWHHFAEYEVLKEQLVSGITRIIEVKNVPSFSIAVKIMETNLSLRQFEAALPEAIVVAFVDAKIGR
jgi:hypothetical protein